MTLTHTVTALAHDARNAATHVASDLGSQAAGLGRNAADIGSDAASSVATAASHLAQQLASKVPTVTVKKRRSGHPLRWVLLVLAAVAAGVAVKKSRAKSVSPASSSTQPASPVAATEPAMG